MEMLDSEKTQNKFKCKRTKSVCKMYNKKKAIKQLRLLRALQNNPDFRANGRSTPLRRSVRIKNKNKKIKKRYTRKK